MMEDSIRKKERLAEIERLGLTDKKVDDLLNDYARKASSELNLPIGLVSIVLDEAQYFIGEYGLEGWVKDVGGTPVEWAFCANSVNSREPFIVENALTNDIVKDNPLVEMEGIRCYAGVPMITTNGHVIGNFCVKGKEDRTFSENQINKLKEMAGEIVEYLENRVK